MSLLKTLMSLSVVTFIVASNNAMANIQGDQMHAIAANEQKTEQKDNAAQQNGQQGAAPADAQANANAQAANPGYWSYYPQGWGPGDYTNGILPGGFHAGTDTVSSIKFTAFDDQIVKMRGRLTDYLGFGYYEFTDIHGDTIRVELDDDRPWGHIQRGQLIDIVGEVDRDYLFFVSIDVGDAMPVPEGAAAPAQTPL